MVPDIVAIVLLVGLPVIAWHAWLALYPGLSLHADYDIRGGWFGTPVTVRQATRYSRSSTS